MKYFTPELIARLGSLDAEVANAADAEWDELLERYEQRLYQIRAALPEHVREFSEVLLHDADVWSLARQGDKLLMVLRKDIPPRDLVILTYTLVADPVIDTTALPPEECTQHMQFMYDEFDLVHEGDQTVYTESILLSNGWEVQLRFRDVQVVLADPVYPVAGTVLVPVATSGVPQSG